MQIGCNDFYLSHSRRNAGNSFTTLTEAALCKLVEMCWEFRKPGAGEAIRLDRKVLVPIKQPSAPVFFCPPRISLVVGLPVQAEVVVRQDGEEPYVQTFVRLADAERMGAVADVPATTVDVVVYSREALCENNGKPTTDCDWEIVTLLCSSGEQEPLAPLTMARNYLEKPGGTKGEYTAREFAESIWYHAGKKSVRLKG